MNILLQRLWQMVLGWGSVGVIYTLSDRAQGQGYLLTPLPIDHWIPFSPSAVWLYLSFFLLVPLGYLFVPLPRLVWLRRAMQLTALGAGLVYMLWPTTLVYPTYPSVGLSAQLLNGLIDIDSQQNCLPSLHAALTLLAVWAIAAKRRHGVTLCCVLWAMAIAFSIIQLRRHLFIDVLSGALLAWVCGWWIARREEKIRLKEHDHA